MPHVGLGDWARVRACLALTLFFAPAWPASTAPTVVTFGLLAESDGTTRSRNPRDDFLVGEIRLYRLGSYVPEVVLHSGVAGPVPAGEWAWIAEGPGYVSRDTGILVVRAGGAARRLVVPVIPACEAQLVGDWRGLDRIDFVSVEQGTTYPLDPQHRRALSIPAGRVFHYTVARDSLVAIGRPQLCRAGESLPISPPSLPDLDRQDMMAHVDLSADPAAPADALRVEAIDPNHLRPAVEPNLLVAVRTRATAVFFDLPNAPLTLRAQHPTLASARQEVVPRAGEAHESSLVLTARKIVEVAVDYQPQRPHGVAAIHLLRCSDEERHFLHLGEGCLEAAPPQALIEGLDTYRFEGLDTGQYLFEARIDDDVFPGLEDALAPFVEPGHTLVALPQQALVEEHIYGHLLFEGEAVPGAVRFERMDGSPPTKVYPTDDDLTYHIYYFGVRDWSDLHPVRRRTKRTGLPAFRVLRACDHDEHCRAFHHRSSYRGSGRFDIDIDGRSNLTVRVFDAETRDAIEGAELVYREDDRRVSPTIHFEDGAVSERGTEDGGDSAEGSAEGNMARTDKNGAVRLRGLAAAAVRLHVHVDGYRDWSGAVQTMADATLEYDVLLERSRPRGGPRAVFADGQAAHQAAFLTFAADGSPDYLCVTYADTLGEVDIPSTCLADEARPWVILHGGALLAETDGAALARSASIELVRIDSSLPLRLRVLRTDGEAVADIPVALRFPRFTLTANHLVAGTRSGLRAQAQTGEDGTIVFPFLAADGALPSAVVHGETFPLVRTQRESVIEVRIP